MCKLITIIHGHHDYHEVWWVGKGHKVNTWWLCGETNCYLHVVIFEPFVRKEPQSIIDSINLPCKKNTGNCHQQPPAKAKFAKG